MLPLYTICLSERNGGNEKERRERRPSSPLVLSVLLIPNFALPLRPALCLRYREAAFARRKRRKAAGGKIVDFPPRPLVHAPAWVGGRLHSWRLRLRRIALNSAFSGSNPPQSRRIAPPEGVVQPLGGALLFIQQSEIDWRRAGISNRKQAPGVSPDACPFLII